MGEPTYGQFMLALVELDSDVESPEVSDPRLFHIFYRDSTNRIVILGDDDGRREIPVMDPDSDFAYGALMLNEVGELDQTPGSTTADPTIDFNNFPTGVRWPQGTFEAFKVGDVLYVSSRAVEESQDASDTDRAVLSWGQAEIKVATATINLDDTFPQELYFNDSGRRFVPTRLVIRDPDISLNDGGTITWVAGSNGGSDDAFGPDKFIEVTGPPLATVWTPKKGFATVTDSDALTVKLSGSYGTGEATVDVFGYYVD